MQIIQDIFICIHYFCDEFNKFMKQYICKYVPSIYSESCFFPRHILLLVILLVAFVPTGINCFVDLYFSPFQLKFSLCLLEYLLRLSPTFFYFLFFSVFLLFLSSHQIPLSVTIARWMHCRQKTGINLNI